MLSFGRVLFCCLFWNYSPRFDGFSTAAPQICAMDGSPTPESDPLSLLHDKSHAAPRSQWSYNTSEPPRRRTSSAMEVGAPDLANSAVVSQEPPPPPAASLRYLAVLSLAVVVLGVGDNIAYKVGHLVT